jgi:hypothetical protein
MNAFKQRTSSIASFNDPGRLKKNFDLSNTPRVDLTLLALDAFSRTGRNTWFALAVAAGNDVESNTSNQSNNLTFKMFGQNL